MKREIMGFALKATYVYALVILGVLVSSIIFYAVVIKPSEDSDTSNTYSVQGTASRKVTPDSAVVTIGTIMEDTNIINLQNKANEKVNLALKDIKALGIKEEDIETNNYTVEPDYDKDNEKITGYSINVALKITIKNTKPEDNAISNVIAKATSAGLNEVRNLTYFIEDEEKILNDLKLEAIDDAKGKANDQADKAGLKLGKIKNIQESGYYPYYNSSYGNKAVDMAESSAGSGTPSVPNTVTRIQMQPGQFELKSAVTLYYEIK